jgi:hypothetical protein
MVNKAKSTQGKGKANKRIAYEGIKVGLGRQNAG